MALGVAVVMIPLAALAGSASAATTASSPGPNTPESVASGIDVASLPGAAVFGTTPADTPETVSFILREQNLNSLKAEVQHGVRNYLSVSQFAGVYGQTEANISALTSYLASFGITTTGVYPGNVDMSASGTAGEFDKALSVTQKNYHVPAQPGFGGWHKIQAQSVYGAAGAHPELPSNLAQYVLAILGLTNYSPVLHQPGPREPAAAENTSSSVLDRPIRPPNYLPSDFAANYGLAGCTRKMPTGRGDRSASSPWPRLTRARRSTSGRTSRTCPPPAAR